MNENLEYLDIMVFCFDRKFASKIKIHYVNRKIFKQFGIFPDFDNIYHEISVV